MKKFIKYKLEYYGMDNWLLGELLIDTLYEVALLMNTLICVNLINRQEELVSHNIYSFRLEAYDKKAKEWVDWHETMGTDINTYLKKNKPKQYDKVAKVLEPLLELHNNLVVNEVC